MGNNCTSNTTTTVLSNVNNLGAAYCGGTTTSSTSSKWLLSPTLEMSSEEKTSLINNLKTDSEGGAGNEEGELQLEHDDALVNLNTSLSSGGFVKLPLEDRNKYEKLRSIDQITSDDSDSEFFQDDYNSGITTSKKAIFKQIVTNNIPESIHKIHQAAYHKVDKTQVKVPIVKKLREKTTTKRPSTAAQQAAQQVNAALEKHEKQQQQAAEIAAAVAAAGEANNDNEDADSIGSASDLRAEDDDFFDENQMNSVSKGNVKLKRPDLDGISESVKTCSSSAYHAECESVTTHEDDISRVVVKVRMRKKDRIAALQSSYNDASIINAPGTGNKLGCEESELSPTSSEFINKLGDKPLLLDDELAYNSADSTDSNNKNSSSDDGPILHDSLNKNSKKINSKIETEELDVFAMAPFKMPKGLPLKTKVEAKNSNRRKSKEMTTSKTSLNRTSEVWTSTPVKNINMTCSDLKKPKTAVATSTTISSRTGVQSSQNIPELDEFNEPIFNPFIYPQSTNPQQQYEKVHIQSSSNYGMVTVISTNSPGNTVPVETSSTTAFIPMAPTTSSTASAQAQASAVTPTQASRTTIEQRDLFDSEPFPQVISKCINNVKQDIVKSDNQYKDHNVIQIENTAPTSTLTITSIHESKPQLVTVNHSIIIDRTSEPSYITPQQQSQNQNLNNSLIIQKTNTLVNVNPLSTYVNVSTVPISSGTSKSSNVLSGNSSKIPLNCNVNLISPPNVLTKSSKLPIKHNSLSSPCTTVSGMSNKVLPATNVACQKLPAYLCASATSDQTIFPIADNGFVQISQERCSDFTPDDEEEPVVLHSKNNTELDATTRSSITPSSSDPIDKLPMAAAVTSSKPKEKKNHLGVRTLPAKLSQKVKGNSYKKVSGDHHYSQSSASGVSHTTSTLGSSSSLGNTKQKHQRSKYKTHTDEFDDEEDYENMISSPNTANSTSSSTQKHSKSFSGKSFGNASFQSNSIKNSAKTGFSNMSFEDFPSDQEMDAGGRSTHTKALPFEVVRNEKALLEAEKKFGSLKRRNNLFS